jgi:hypothetical protein
MADWDAKVGWMRANHVKWAAWDEGQLVECELGEVPVEPAQEADERPPFVESSAPTFPDFPGASRLVAKVPNGAV